MEYVIYLSMFLLAGFVFGRIINKLGPKKKDYKYETAMLEAQLKWFGSPEWEKWNDAMNELEKQKHPILSPLHFGDSYWTKSKKAP